MSNQTLQHKIEIYLKEAGFGGSFHFDELHRVLYATDASAYREMPLAVAYPKTQNDIVILINTAKHFETTLIPRTAGTSLAGQVVGNGIIVDISKYFTNIIDINRENKTVTVQPGVILDELNMTLKPYNLFFGPETSTSNRCMIGGMIGNNACGAHSLIYGSTRDHLLAVKVILSDSSQAEFNSISNEVFINKTQEQTLEGQIYKYLYTTLNKSEVQEEIKKEFPDKEIKRRNTGYAIDILLNMQPFNQNGSQFNLAKLIAGSEGTLAFITEATLQLVDLPQSNKLLICAHFETLEESLEANLIALKHAPASVELMDKPILDLTKENQTQNKNRFFVKGDPGAILIIELSDTSYDALERRAKDLIDELKSHNYGYHYPIIWEHDMKKVWDLRKAGLGVLSNMPGDAKPVPVIEDTAVSPEKLPAYIREFKQLLDTYNLSCVYYAHVGTGELHLRPILNLKIKEDVDKFRNIAYDTACLVKKYGGSLSGEHGDGRLRGEFIQLMLGEKNYQLLKELKQVWDPLYVFNNRKITDTPPMDTSLRYETDRNEPKIETVFDFDEEGGILRAIEKCNGSADCRRTHLSGGTMCPSYMATLDEQHSTRARANILREFLTNSEQMNVFDHAEIYNVLDLCLSCKACKSECPSNVDMTAFKTEFLQHYYDAHHIPLRTKVIAHITTLNKLGMIAPPIYNALVKNKSLSGILKRIIGFAQQRSLPLLPKRTLVYWAKQYLQQNNPTLSHATGKLILFIDEFSNYQDAAIGQAVIKLLTKLNYHIQLESHDLSGRTFLSKGLLRKAKKIAHKNIVCFANKVNADCPLVGIEPSAILGFRDEYIRLVRGEMKEHAKSISSNTYLFEEFLHKEFQAGHILSEQFEDISLNIKMHGHCHQKALSDTKILKAVLEIPANCHVTEIQSGCCGMAGAFGYEKEHYEVSMKTAELVLFPTVRAASNEDIIVAPGTSCREQIKDGTGRIALHPAQVLLLLIQ